MKLRRVFGILFALCLAVGVFALSASAERVASGACGENLMWKLETTDSMNSQGRPYLKLTILGEGEMYNYSPEEGPWSEYVYQISEAVIEDGVTSIGSYAFAYLDCLGGIEIPDSVTSIGNSAFRGCGGLPQISLPDSVEHIGEHAFERCFSIQEFEIPEKVTCIESATFKDCSALKNIVIPENVTYIEQDAFYKCLSLKNITIPAAVRYIGNYAFLDCTALCITFQGDAPSFGTDIFLSANNVKAYYPVNNETWTESIRTEDRTGPYANHISWVATCMVPHTWVEATCAERKHCSVCKIEEGDLLSHSYKNGVCAACGMVEGLEYEIFTEEVSGDRHVQITGYAGSVEKLVIPAVIESVPVKGIDYCAFCGNESLKTVSVPNTVTTIGDEAFSRCTNLEEISVPDSVTYIGIGAFRNCARLKSITVPDGVLEICDRTFSGCTGLEHIVLPDELIRIGKYAFEGCKIDSMTVPNGVERIQGYVFKDCSELRKVILPASVSVVDYEVISGCSDIAVTFLGDAPEIDFEAFYLASDVTAYYPQDNETWTESVRKNYGGTRVTWKPYTSGNHVWAEATCTVPQTCIVCGVTTGTARGHDTINYEAKVPTCTEIGWDAYETCTRCDYTTYAEKAALGHDKVSHEAKAPTCTEIGWDAYETCSRCDYTTYAEKAALGEHQYGGNSVCTVCGMVEGLEYAEYDDHVVITGYTGSAPELPIPAKINEKPVTEIGDYAFSWCRSIKRVIVPDGVTRIGAEAFNICENLESVVLPDSVTSIGHDAFSDCDSIKSFDLPKNLQSVESRLFAACSNLESVTIPGGVTDIGREAFVGCGSLKSIVIPEGVTSIGEGAFNSCESLKRVELPDSIQHIEKYAFCGCSSLTDIEIPNRVEVLEEYVFISCSGLTQIVIPDSVTRVENYAFADCGSLRVEFSGNAPVIYDLAFNSSDHITVYYPKDNESWTSDVMLDYGGNVTWKSACSGEHTWVSATCLDPKYCKNCEMTEGEALGHDTLIHAAKAPTCTEIGWDAYETCSRCDYTTYVEKAKLGHDKVSHAAKAPTCTAIGWNAYVTCSRCDYTTYAEKAALGHDEVSHAAKAPTCTAIGWNAYETCSRCDYTTYAEKAKLDHHFENNLCTVCGMVKGLQYALYDSYAEITGYTGTLSVLRIPASIEGKPVKGIRSLAFELCKVLTSVTLPDGLTYIGDRAFSACINLRSITIPESVTSIGEGAFAACSITSVTIPNGVKHIANDTFGGCGKLTSVTIPDSVTSIGYYAFNECTSLKSIKLPQKLTSISWFAFYGCTGLKSITVPDSVASIGESAFQMCTGLESVKLPSGINRIESRAFSDCGSLQSITLPDTVTSIGNGAFFNCTKLTRIVIPKNVTLIESSAFAWCFAVKNIVFLGDQPERGADIFSDIQAKAYFPAGNSTWDGYDGYTGDYGTGVLTWEKTRSLKITAQPKNAYAQDGKIAKTTVSAAGNALTYTWYYKDAGETKFKKSSVATSTYSTTMDSTKNGCAVYCVIKDFWGNETKTDTVYHRMAASVVTQPKTTYTKSGSTAKVTVKAAGDGLTYTWYVKNKSAVKFTKSSNTTSTYSVTMSSTTKDRQVYCVVKDKYGKTVQTNTVYLRMAASVTTQPKTTYTKNGSTAKVTVKAAGDGLKYTWYYKNKGASKFTKSSVTTSTYSTKMSSTTKDRQVYCVVKDKYGKTVETNKVYLRMAASITTQPKTTYTKSGSTAKVTVKVAGDGLKYAWYVKNKGASKFTKVSAATSTYSVKMSSTTKDRQVYCVVKDKYGKTAKTNTVTLRMAVSITTQPKSVTVKKNATAKVTVKAAGDGLKYTWYYKNKGAAKFTKATATTAAYSVKMTSKVNGRQVYCVVKDKYGKTVKSSTATLKMK